MSATVRNLGLLGGDIPPDRTAIIDLSEFRPRTLSYGEFRTAVTAVACGLAAQGIGRGDRVGILSLNRAEYLTLLFGIVLAGAVAVPLNVKLPAETLAAILRQDGVRLIFAEHEFTRLAPEGTPLIRFGAEYRAFLKFCPFEAAAVTADEISMQPYTSGSTGLPKGVLLTHAGQYWAAETLAEFRRLRPTDRAILAAPLYHKNAIVAAKTALASGGTMIIMPRFEAGGYARSIGQWGVTMLTGVPTMMRLLLDDPCLPPAEIRGNVRVVSMGSSSASDSLLADIRAAFPNAEIHMNYGTTEGGPIMFGWYHPDGKPRPSASIGYPIPGCEWRLEGPKPDEGELWVRNPGVAKGYFNRPEATAKSFQDGWYKTGDILRRDADGWFYFVSRIDDMMVTGGENVFPQEVEALLEQHPAVRQAAVIAVPHEIKGEVPVAFVVLQEGQTVDEAALKQFALAHAPAYAHPRRVYFVPSLPLTGTNKIDKTVLKQWVQNDSAPIATSGKAAQA
ncbi:MULTISPECIES: class I adenylate-forming enzyme family protein [Rhodomicrobium]|uniref:class I adenylate-forming enzyme family protein n=1 Tax=Rhodomicrobium TaxID=1068 RepID=UPI000B4B2093|nr:MULTISPECIES: class I adenylate-forming enzyme family protein [Rhodomicrobium]